MTYEQRQELKPGDFKGACGMHPRTMAAIAPVPALSHRQGLYRGPRRTWTGRCYSAQVDSRPPGACAALRER